MYGDVESLANAELQTEAGDGSGVHIVHRGACAGQSVQYEYMHVHIYRRISQCTRVSSLYSACWMLQMLFFFCSFTYMNLFTKYPPDPHYLTWFAQDGFNILWQFARFFFSFFLQNTSKLWQQFPRDCISSGYFTERFSCAQELKKKKRRTMVGWGWSPKDETQTVKWTQP